MYNGLQGVSFKGTGLSGYVQRSRVNIQQRRHRYDAGEGGLEGREGEEHALVSSSSSALSTNPLAIQRSHQENEKAAARLARHKARRHVHLQVLHYKEQRLGGAKGSVKSTTRAVKEEESVADACQHVSEATVEREANELYKSLMEEVERQEHAEDQKLKAKSAASFAAAFEVRTNHRTWDHAQLQREKQLLEEQRREKAQINVAERIKRLRRENDGTDENVVENKREM